MRRYRKFPYPPNKKTRTLSGSFQTHSFRIRVVPQGMMTTLDVPAIEICRLSAAEFNVSCFDAYQIHITPSCISAKNVHEILTHKLI